MQDFEIAAIFNRCFRQSEQTELVGGACEPLFEPMTAGTCATLYYRENFAASALHESAHWCIAGLSRRAQVDFGYAYVPPPRTLQQQERFFNLEVKTQALESLFAEAAGIEFQPSADNLSVDIKPFFQALRARRPDVLDWMRSSVDDRALTFYAALKQQSSLMREKQDG